MGWNVLGTTINDSHRPKYMLREYGFVMTFVDGHTEFTTKLSDVIFNVREHYVVKVVSNTTQEETVMV